MTVRAEMTAALATLSNLGEQVISFTKPLTRLIFTQKNGLSYVDKLKAAKQREEDEAVRLKEVLTAKTGLADARKANAQLRREIKKVEERK